MSYDLVSFNECRKLILHSVIKYSMINHHNYSLFQLSLLGENFLENVFSATLHQFWRRAAYLTTDVGNRH